MWLSVSVAVWLVFSVHAATSRMPSAVTRFSRLTGSPRLPTIVCGSALFSALVALGVGNAYLTPVHSPLRPNPAARWMVVGAEIAIAVLVSSSATRRIGMLSGAALAATSLLLLLLNTLGAFFLGWGQSEPTLFVLGQGSQFVMMIVGVIYLFRPRMEAQYRASYGWALVGSWLVAYWYVWNELTS